MRRVLVASGVSSYNAAYAIEGVELTSDNFAFISTSVSAGCSHATSSWGGTVVAPQPPSIAPAISYSDGVLTLSGCTATTEGASYRDDGGTYIHTYSRTTCIGNIYCYY